MLVGEALVTAKRYGSQSTYVDGRSRARQSVDSVAAPRVKICGVRSLEGALAAADAGADYFGMVFVPGRRRRIEPGDALSITNGLRESRPNTPLSVGLFGDQPLDEVIDTIREARLDGVQLCGEEPLEYCQSVLDHVRVIKVLHVPNDADAASVEELAGQY